MELKWTATRQGQLSSFLKGEMDMSSGLMNKLKWGQALRVNGVPQRLKKDNGIRFRQYNLGRNRKMPEKPSWFCSRTPANGI